MSTTNIGLRDVQGVYSGPEGQLWELVMGQQIHIGGLQLVDGAGREGRHRAGHDRRRSLLLQRRRDAVPRPLPQRGDRMHGVDATETVVELGRRRCEAEGLADRITFTLADACQTACPAPAPISSGAKTPGATWSTRSG